MNTILLTGGSGFIGRNILEQLSGKYQILAPRHKDLPLEDQAAVKSWFHEHKPWAVIHSATKPGHRNAPDPKNIFAANIRMLSNLMESSMQNKVSRFLFLGSGSEFGMEYYKPYMHEDYLGEHVPLDDTGFSKYICNRMISGIPGFVNVRFFGIFGKYEDYAIRFISNNICKALFDLPLTLRQDRNFSYTFIDDGIRAIDHFLMLPSADLRYTDYNVTPSQSVSLLDLAQLIRRIANKPTLPIHIQMQGIGSEYSGDNSRFFTLFPSFRFTPLEESVKMLYDWYASNIDQINPDWLLEDK